MCRNFMINKFSSLQEQHRVILRERAREGHILSPHFASNTRGVRTSAGLIALKDCCLRIVYNDALTRLESSLVKTLQTF